LGFVCVCVCGCVGVLGWVLVCGCACVVLLDVRFQVKVGGGGCKLFIRQQFKYSGFF